MQCVNGCTGEQGMAHQFFLVARLPAEVACVEHPAKGALEKEHHRSLQAAVVLVKRSSLGKSLWLHPCTSVHRDSLLQG